MSCSDETQRMESGNTVARRFLDEFLHTECSDQGGFQFSVPEPGTVGDIADHWLRDPELMLKQLSGMLKSFCSKYFDHDCFEGGIDSDGNPDLGGSSFSLKPECTNSVAFTLACVNLQTIAKALDSVTDINPQVPFVSELLTNLRFASMPFNADEFAKAVTAWTIALRRLAVWVKLQATTTEMPQEVHGVTLAMIASARQEVRRNPNTTANVLTSNLGNRATANLSLRVLEALGEYSRFQRRPTPKVTAEVRTIIAQLQLAPQ